MSIRCFKCSAENADTRKYCGECGSFMGAFCQVCGFYNSLSDKYCGGCGFNLKDKQLPGMKEKAESQPSSGMVGKYSADDISELVDEGSRKKEQMQKKKDIKDTDEVSQDLIDGIFGPGTSDTKNNNS